MKQIDYIIIHCSATPKGRNVQVAEVDRWHRAKGWRCIGYHYVIELDGAVRQGRQESQTGAHCLGLNDCSIGICYIGGLDSRMKPCDTRTAAQRISLTRLVKELLRKYPQAKVAGHNQFAAKACPSFSVPQWARQVGIPLNRIAT